MKRILISFSLIIIAIAMQAQNLQVAGIAFYNLENLFDTIPNNPQGKDEEFTPQGKRQWDSTKYWNKIQNLAFAISMMKTSTTPDGPAILGVAEVENVTVLQDLVADSRIKDQNWQIVHHDSPDARGIDVGLLYRSDMFEVESVTNHKQDGVPFATRDVMCVVGKLLGERIAILVNHWPSRLGGTQKSSPHREAAAAKCLQIAQNLWKSNPDMGIIIMGDLNDDPHDRSCAKVLDAKKVRYQAKDHGFYNPWWQILDDGTGTLEYKGNWNLFDQIIISGNLANGPMNRWHFTRAEVLNYNFLRQQTREYYGLPLRTFAGGEYLNGYSDHFPTEIFLAREIK